ncbi:MAG: pre-peptidase C-terminal domain-containing protein, partial [Planctomycetes bacterium]|nr:pre-peptidase C-terminal domain-containing protein [Planctomycetota bacterium]
MSLRELEHVSSIVYMRPSKLQPNRQLAESVLIEVTIDADAEPGPREIRITTAEGVTRPIIFQVGLLPETRELEPNNTKAYPKLKRVPDLPPEKPLSLPVVLNGQVMPGDVDRFRFRATKGQRLVIETQARSLIPYLADAVPGWFQATVALYDASGNEVAYADDYRFSPDPVLFYEIKTPGIYDLQICDSIYRGRQDFVYRISISEQPFITEMFPLGGKSGVETVAAIDGWNLPEKNLKLETSDADGMVKSTIYYKNGKASNAVAYAVDTLSEVKEGSANDTIRVARQISLPTIINGQIEKEGDVDVFRFKGNAGDEIVAEVYARKLNSPLDSLLRLTDAKGKVLEWNDDYMVKESHLHKDITGLTTHHADSYLTAKLPKSGTYYIHLADSQNHGGQAYGYRLRISAPQPDFALRITPSSLSLREGFIVPVSV